MSVERVTNWEELCALQSGWNTLAGNSPFRSWDWLATWWKHYGDDSSLNISQDHSSRRKLFVLAVYDDRKSSTSQERQLIGIAPWYTERSAIKGRVVSWLGNGEVCTDHSSLICDPNGLHTVVAAIAQSLSERDDWDALELSAVDEEDCHIPS